MTAATATFNTTETMSNTQTASNAAPTKAAAAAPSKRVVILGALSGIAMSTARIYAKEGAAIMLVARNTNRLAEVAADLKTRGAFRVETAIVDLEADANKAPELLATWANTMGGIDHVVIFHGYLGEQGKAWESNVELARIVSANYASPVLWAGAAGDMMRKQKHGSVVALASVAGDRGRQSNFAYGSAKAGLATFMQGMAHGFALEKTKARAVAVKPGPTDTAMTAGMKMAKAKPEDVAKAVRRAADKGGPIQYAPAKWKIIMMIIRAVPSFVFHKTKL